MYRRSATALYGTGSGRASRGALVTDEQTLAELAYKRIRYDIVAGVLKPEEKLRIALLAKRYGVGPGPARRL